MLMSRVLARLVMALPIATTWCNVSGQVEGSEGSESQPPAAAPESADLPDAALGADDSLELRFTPYLWAASLDGDLAVGRFSADLDVGFLDILDS